MLLASTQLLRTQCLKRHSPCIMAQTHCCHIILPVHWHLSSPLLHALVNRRRTTIYMVPQKNSSVNGAHRSSHPLRTQGKLSYDFSLVMLLLSVGRCTSVRPISPSILVYMPHHGALLQPS